jgi:hypothetical protein
MIERRGSHRQVRFRVRRCLDDERLVRLYFRGPGSAAEAAPCKRGNDRERVGGAAREKRRRRAELTIARAGVGEHEKGEGGIEQDSGERECRENPRAVQHRAGYKAITEMAREKHDRQQCKIRDEIEQKIGHIDGMKAPRIAVLLERLLPPGDSGLARPRRSLHVFMSQ